MCLKRMGGMKEVVKGGWIVSHPECHSLVVWYRVQNFFETINSGQFFD